MSCPGTWGEACHREEGARVATGAHGLSKQSSGEGRGARGAEDYSLCTRAQAQVSTCKSDHVRPRLGCTEPGAVGDNALPQ